MKLHKKARNTFIALLVAAGFFNCGKDINPLKPYIPKTEDVGSGVFYSGDTASATKKIDVKADVEAQSKAPNGNYGPLETLTSDNGEFTKSFATSTYGDYKVNFEIDPVKGEPFSEEEIVGVYMNEIEGDNALRDVLASMTNSSSAVDFDILRFEINRTNAFGGGEVVDGVVTYRLNDTPGNERYYGIDLSGDASDVFSQTKKDNINNSGGPPPSGWKNGYLHLGNKKSKQGIKNRILQEKTAGWPDRF